MKPKLHVIGAGGHARSYINLMQTAKLDVAGVFDSLYIPGTPEIICGVHLIGTLDDILPDHILALAVGDNQKRKDFLDQFHPQVYAGNVVHPSAVIENHTTLGKYNQIFARTVINAGAHIGNNNIINTGCIVEHEVKAGNHNHLSVGSILCGRVTVGDLCFIGAGAVIKDKVTICSNVTIGANSTVIKDITEPGVYVGCPVRQIKSC